jgi:hypothetical protein
MQIEFFDDPLKGPASREDVRIKRIGLFIHDGSRRLTFGLELTPFLERPSIEVSISNAAGEAAGALTVIESMTYNFSLIIHLRDGEVNDPYMLTTTIYYATPGTERVNVDRQTVTFNAAAIGEQIFAF